ncbi:acyltransferase [Lachnospiraceae bacterium]|nr:acyltransferase [Lachnospiraceae bacterium]
MSLILLLFFIIFLTGAKLAKRGEFFSDYLSLEKSNSVKGIFVIFVFFRHYAQYVELDSIWDKGFSYINYMLGQMIVVAFLFYSGYGVLCSMEKKGISYVKSLPFQRAFRVWIHYAIAVGFFWIVNLALGRELPARKIIGTLLCWDAIGNSTWYIMAIVISYLLAYFSFRFCFDRKKLGAALLTGLTICAIIILAPVRPGRYYNTLLCFPLGVWWAIYKKEIDAFLKKGVNYGVSLSLCIIITVVANGVRNYNVWIYELASVSFVCTGILITMKLSLKNPLIQYAGNHVFSLFILQRLPMLYLSKATDLEKSPYVFFAVTFLITAVISWVFDWCMDKFDKQTFGRLQACSRGQ